MRDTIFALSSGAPPAAIGVIRISGPQARTVLEKMAGSIPSPRMASLRTLRDADGGVLDSALVLWFPGPNTATGEDLAEFHCHGGLAITRAVQGSLSNMAGLRPAAPGEFTRRAFENGCMDLSEAEGLADLLAAETELQRLSALDSFGGALSRKVTEWRQTLISISASLEALMDFSDEDDVEVDLSGIVERAAALREDVEATLQCPPVERLRDGVRVVLAGPPNAGKSSLFNALLQDDAAIVSEQAGTTRDAIERSVSFEGVPITLVDTAGVREGSDDKIEQIGIARAQEQFDRADIVLWLGVADQGPTGSIEVASKSDLRKAVGNTADHLVSAVTGEGIAGLIRAVSDRARSLLPKPGTAALNARQRMYLSQASSVLAEVTTTRESLLLAEQLRLARVAFEAISGHGSTEEMLDTIFSNFCIGK